MWNLGYFTIFVKLGTNLSVLFSKIHRKYWYWGIGVLASIGIGIDLEQNESIDIGIGIGLEAEPSIGIGIDLREILVLVLVLRYENRYCWCLVHTPIKNSESQECKKLIGYKNESRNLSSILKLGTQYLTIMKWGEGTLI